MRGIRLLKERNIPVKLNFTLIPWNREDMDNIIWLSEEQKIPMLMSAYLILTERKENHAGCDDVPEGYIEIELNGTRY